MPNYLKHNGGYSLLVVLLIVTILSIVGLTLTGLMANSLKFVQVNNQTITNKTSADMAVEEGMAQIGNAVDTINTNISKNSNLTISNIQTQLKSALDGIKNLGSFSYTLTHSTVNDGSNGGAYVEKVAINAPLGTSGKYLTKTITISTIPNVFKYTTVTPGSLTLNGASYIGGDVSVGGDIQTSNYGRFMENSTYYPVPTSYPAINGSLTVLGNYKYSSNSNWTWNTFTPTPTNLSSYFSIPPTINSNSLSVETFNITNLVNGKNGSLSTSKSYSSGSYSSTTTLSSGSTFTSNLTISSTGNVTVNGNLIVNGNLTIAGGGKLTVNGSIKVSGTATLSGTLTLNNKNSYMYINGSTSIDTLNLNGQMYINNTLSVQNDLNTNGTIYTSGDVTVQNLSNTSGGTLVLLTDGNIQLSNNNLYNDTPKTINAFFYSNKVLEIYGVGSNLKIIGGIYGNQIILNAVKGKSSQSSFPNSFPVSYISGYSLFWPVYSNLYFQNNQNAIDPTNSRLSVIYQKDLILNPPQGIPTVQNLTIKEIDTTYSN